MAEFWRWFWDELGWAFLWAIGALVVIEVVEALFGKAVATAMAAAAFAIGVWLLWLVRTPASGHQKKGEG